MCETFDQHCIMIEKLQSCLSQNKEVIKGKSEQLAVNTGVVHRDDIKKRDKEIAKLKKKTGE